MYCPSCQAGIFASILEFNLFARLKKQLEVYHLTCETVTYDLFSFVNFCQVPVPLRGTTEFPKQVLFPVAWGHPKTVSDEVVIDAA